MQGVQERGPRAGDKIGTPWAWQCKVEEERWGPWRHLKGDDKNSSSCITLWMYSFTTRRRHKRNFLGPSPIHYLSRGGRSLAGQTYFRLSMGGLTWVGTNGAQSRAEKILLINIHEMHVLAYDFFCDGASDTSLRLTLTSPV